MSVKCAELIHKYPKEWEEAAVHPFLDQCADGSIQAQQFNTWLLQDYHFVTDFTRLLAKTLAAAPVAHFDVLLSGLHALQDELNWFREKAAERDLSLDVERQETCKTYCAWMQQWGEQAYAVQATAVWAIELAYNQGWQRPGPMKAPYAEFADRWGNPLFTEYVKLLEQQADEALAAASPEVQAEAEAAFKEVALQEKAFWQMAFAVQG